MSVHENDHWHDLYKSPELVARRRAKHLVKLRRLGILDLPRDSKIADLCCGQGEMLDLLEGFGFSDLTGVDHAPESGLIKGKSERRWRYLESNIPELPFLPASLDCILCTHALHHLEGIRDIGGLLSAASMALKKGGLLAVTDHYDSLQLRFAFSMLRSPLALLSGWSRQFRFQLIQEHEYLYRYLDHWGEIQKLFEEKSRFSRAEMHRGLFFFYYKAWK